MQIRTVKNCDFEADNFSRRFAEQSFCTLFVNIIYINYWLREKNEKLYCFEVGDAMA